MAWAIEVLHVLVFLQIGNVLSHENNQRMHYSGGQKLLYPFVTFSSLGYVIHIVSIYFSGDRNWIHYILTPMKELVLGGSIGGNDVLWFLTSLFLVQVLFNEMTMKNIKAPYVAIGGIIIAYLCHFLHIDKPAYLANVALGISMYSLGFMWKESQFTASSMSIATIIYISIMLIHPLSYRFENKCLIRQRDIFISNSILYIGMHRHQ